jgi:RNA polymerase sigma factor (sigma-70 family)
MVNSESIATTSDDEALARIVASGAHDAATQDAFLSLYDRYAVWLLSYLCRMGLDPDRAEEAAQEAWQRVWNKMPDCRERTGTWFRPWLFHVAHNCGISCHRATSKHATVALEYCDENHNAGRQTPLDVVLDKERQAVVEDCLKRLRTFNESAAEVLRRRLAGQDFRTISDDLGITNQRAHRILFDAKTKMSQCVERSWG